MSCTVGFGSGCVERLVPLLHSSEPSLFLTPAGAWDDPTCASVWGSRILPETSSHLRTLLIYLVLTFLFTVHVLSALNPDHKSYFTAVLFVFRSELYLVQTNSNLSWNLAFHKLYKEGMPHWNRSHVSRCSIQGRKMTRSQYTLFDVSQILHGLGITFPTSGRIYQLGYKWLYL